MIQNERLNPGIPALNHPGRKLNPLQALFGTIWGVWFGSITKDILTSEISPLISVDLSTLKILFIVASLIFLGGFILCYDVFQRYVYSLADHESAADVIRCFLRILLIGALIIVIFPGFLLTTYMIFPKTINFFLILFGIIQLVVWVALELVMALLSMLARD